MRTRISLLAVVGLGLSWSLSAASARGEEFRAFWVDAWGAGFLNQSQVDDLLGKVGDPSHPDPLQRGTLGKIREANLNAVIVQVRRRADVCYPSGMGEPYFTTGSFNALQAMLNAAHDTSGGKKRIEIHCWVVAFKTGRGTVYDAHNDTPTGDPVNHDNYWPTRLNSAGGAENDDGAFDPGHPRCLKYLVDVCMDLVDRFDIDGLHYDYIRFEAGAEGFNPTSVARYKARYGLSTDPVTDDEQFKQWRRDQVTALVRQVYARIQSSKPWVLHSGSFVTWNPSPVASTRDAFKATRPYYDVYSDWDSWIQEGLIDLSVPMTYYDKLYLEADFIRWMNFEKDRKGKGHMIVGPGTYHNNLDNAILELLMTRDPSPAGNYAEGFSGYCYRNPYYLTWKPPDPSTTYGTWANFAPRLIAEVTPTWADIPPRSWKDNPTTGHISGTVTFAGSNAWADHATVSITGQEDRGPVYVDGTGFYAFIDLEPGSYTITASKPGYVDAIATANVQIGAVTGDMYVRDLQLATSCEPIITGVVASNITDHVARVTWTTNIPANSQVEYGPTTAYGSSTPLDGTLVTSHTVDLSGLAPKTLYHYRVISGDACGTTQSGDFTFTTSGPPAITNVQTTPAATSAVVTWTTDLASNSQVFYGPTASYGSSSPLDASNVTAHSVTLSSLTPETLYHYKVVSANAYGSAESTDATFLTPAVGAEIVIDNTDAACTRTGTWTSGSVATVPKIGATYLYANPSGSESSTTATCRWTPNIPAAGYYDVYVFYQIGSNRNPAAPYTVVYNGGSVTSIQNQYSTTPNLGGWFLVGQNLPFAAGTTGYVQVGNNSASSGLISADAAKFVRVSTRAITSWQSLRSHTGLGLIGIPLNATATGNGATGPTVEPRGTPGLGMGIRTIRVTFDGPVTLLSPAAVTVTGWTTTGGVVGGPQSYPPLVQAAGANALDIDVTGIPDASCCRIELGAGALAEFLPGDTDCMVRALCGDVAVTGDVALADLSLTKSKFGQSAALNAKCDVTLSGDIGLADLSLVKSRFGKTVLCP